MFDEGECDVGFMWVEMMSRRVPRWWIRGWRGCLVIFNCSLGNNTHRVTVSYPSRPPFQPNHRLVEETLTPLDPDRRAFRLVGGVLVRCSFRGRCGRCANCLTFLMVHFALQSPHVRRLNVLSEKCCLL